MQPKESKSNKHFNISMVKSAIRIGAGINLALGNIWYAGIFLVMAEILGIAEEF